MELKKRIFGGYKKTSVDAAISELNQKIEESQANSKALQHEIEIKDSKISDFMKRNEELKLENEKLKSEKSENDLIFKNLAKIYQHTFEAGNQIVSEAKETASSLMANIDNRMDEMVRYSQTILSDYDNIHQETEDLLSSLNNNISKIRQNVFTSIHKAKALADVYDRMHDATQTTSDKIRQTLDEYQLQASTFLSENTSKAEEKPAESIFESKVETSTGAYTAKPAEIFKVISNSVQEEPTPEVTENEVQPSLPTNEEVSEKTTVLVLDTVEEVPFENKVEEAEKPEETPTQPEEQPKEQAEIEQLKHPEQTEQPTAAAENENSTPDFGFTQYGRKSKLTAQERNEFIRKALIKNGG